MCSTALYPLGSAPQDNDLASHLTSHPLTGTVEYMKRTLLPTNTVITLVTVTQFSIFLNAPEFATGTASCAAWTSLGNTRTRPEHSLQPGT